MSTHQSTQAQEFGARWIPGLLAVLLAYLVWSGSPWSLGLTPDSLSYVRSVGLLTNGWQIELLPTQWPPGFSFCLAIATLVFGSLLTAARVVQALVGATSVLLCLNIMERCGLRRPYSFLFALLLLIQPGFLDIHLMMWSEPLFLLLALVDVLLLTSLLDEPGRPGKWLLLGLACAGAMMVRYAGLFLVLVNGLSILYLAGPQLGRRRRIVLATATAGVSLMPLVAWAAFNHFRGLSGTNRVLAWHPVDGQQIAALAHTLAGWLQLPDAFGLPIGAVIVLSAIVVLMSPRFGAAASPNGRRIFSLYLFSYIGFLWLSLSFADHATPLDERILFPVLPASLAILAFALQRGGELARSIALAGAIPLLFLLCLGGYAGWQDWRYSRTEGFGMANRVYREMPVLEWLRRVPHRFKILSNGPELLNLYVEREAELFPEKFSPMSRQPEPGYAKNLTTALNRTDLVVYFYPMASRDYLPSIEELERIQGLRKIYVGEDAVVWSRTRAMNGGGDRP